MLLDNVVDVLKEKSGHKNQGTNPNKFRYLPLQSNWRRAPEQTLDDCKAKLGAQEGENHVHTNDVVVSSPNIDINSIEDSEEGEAPWNSVNYNLLSLWEELVDDRSEQENMNQRPGAWC